MKRSLLAGAVLALGVVFAHEEPKGKTITVTGQVIDTGCYVAQGTIPELSVVVFTPVQTQTQFT